MLTKTQIDKKYLKLHDNLSKRYYDKHEFPKDEFDQLHAEIWRNHESELIDAGLREPVHKEPPRHLATEIDELKARVKSLEEHNGG